MDNDKLIFTNGEPTFSRKFKSFINVAFKDIIGYANVLYRFEKLPWKLDPKFKPSEDRCFKIKYLEHGEPTSLYFCVYYKKADFSKQRRLNTSTALYINDIWVSIINKKIMLFNVANSQEKLMRSEGRLDCNSHLLEPIKYLYRFKVCKFF